LKEINKRPRKEKGKEVMQGSHFFLLLPLQKMSAPDKNIDGKLRFNLEMATEKIL